MSTTSRDLTREPYCFSKAARRWSTTTFASSGGGSSPRGCRSGYSSWDRNRLRFPGTIFAPAFARTAAMLKALLLNQEFLRGLGNIYADEALFRARIHPRTNSAKVGPKRSARLHQAIQDVLDRRHCPGGFHDQQLRQQRRLAGVFSAQHVRLWKDRRMLQGLWNADSAYDCRQPRHPLLPQVPEAVATFVHLDQPYG